MASLTPPPYPVTGPFSPPTEGHAASISEDSDDYGDSSNIIAPRHDQGHVDSRAASTSSATPTATATATTSGISINATSDGLRERARSPYSGSVGTPSSIPKREATIIPDVGAAAAVAAISAANSKGKQRAVEEEEEETKPDTSNDNPFACHICLEVPATDDAVLSKCGHLFCWSDLSAWLESNPPTSHQCPVCKSLIKDIQEDVIPIYSGGVGSKKQIDPRTKPRPKPRVTPAPLTRGGGGGGGGGFFAVGGRPFWDVTTPAGPGGWQVQAGIFPFPGLSMSWSNAPRPGGGPMLYNGLPPGAPLTPEMQEQARRQQRNALIAFVVMIVLFSLLATLGEMDMD